MPDVAVRDAERVAWLERLELLDLVPERVFDDIVALASQICGTPVALLTVIGETEQWFKARVGTEVVGTPRDISFCTHAIEQREVFVIEDLRADARFANNPIVTGGPQVRFYMGAPFHSHDGVALGTICVLDVVPRSLGAEQRGALQALARQVEALLELRRRTLEAEERGKELCALQQLLRETNETATREAQLLSAIMAEMPEPVMLFDNVGTILRFNKAAETSYGHAATDVVGKNAVILQPAIGCENQMAKVRAALDAEGLFRGPVTGVTKDGEAFPIETAIRVITVESGQQLCLAVNRDLREQKRTAEMLFASNELFRNAFDCAAVGMALVEIGGRVQRVNEAIANLYEMEPSELVGRPVTDFVRPEALAQVRTALPALAATDAASFHVESSIQATSGVRAVVASVSIVKDITGQGRLLAIQLQDITERRKAEAKLVAAMEAAENANRAKSVFLGNMSHELRTPLNAILGFARVLERGRFGPLNGQQSTYVRDIIESGTHMLTLVEELLELRALEDGLSRFVVGPIELKAAFDDAVRMTYELAFEKRHTLVIEPVTSSLKVAPDHRAVVQVLVNLLSNAIKYTPPNGRIRVSAEQDEEAVTIHIEDNGVGLALEEQAKLFREFERLGRRADGDAPGTGLGLALTKRLVEALGGEVFVRSAVGEGSRFSFTLRRAVSSVRAAMGGEKHVE